MPNANEIDRIIRDSLFREDELAGGTPKNYVMGEGVMGPMGFHPERLESHREEVVAQLRDLPDSFMADGGGGMSFLNMCEDRDGNLWGQHPIMSALCAIGNALGLVSFPMPREMWGVLPGGVPYVTVTLPVAAS